MFSLTTETYDWNICTHPVWCSIENDSIYICIAAVCIWYQPCGHCLAIQVISGKYFGYFT